MGTALTAEQMAELGRAAPLVVLALDADRSGQEAMLRAAQHGGVELRAVEMPEGSDPADLLAAGGAEAFAKRLEGALAMVQFQVRRVLADADLGTPTGRDKALEEARSLIAATPERTAMRDELVREIADRLDVPAEYVRAPAERPRRASSAPPPRRRCCPPARRRARSRFARSASSSRCALRAASWDSAICLYLRTSSSPRMPCDARASTSPPTSTTRWPASPRTSRRSPRSSPTSSMRRRSSRPSRRAFCA